MRLIASSRSVLGGFLQFIRARTAEPLGSDLAGREEIVPRSGWPDADDHGNPVGDEQALEPVGTLLDQAVAAGQPGKSER
ncbi:MAG: hypothetical protein IPK93_12790 [Solirubrobacterales bacterium]|nr:hypothetical protein [Solirubrobacterales bacterium]